MFNFIKRKEVEEPKPDKNEHAVIVEGAFESGEEFGTEEERNMLLELEAQMEKLLQQAGYEFDGHDIGDSGFILYIYGSSADKMFDLVEKPLRRAPFVQYEITKRYGPPEDGVRSKSFSLTS